MKTSLTFFAAILIMGSALAQGSLEFNQVKIVSSTQETVPVGKVWKITSINGRVDGICYPYYNLNFGTIRYAIGYGSGIKVDGTAIINQITDRTGSSHYNDVNCTTSASTNWSPTQPTVAVNPNALPMWLPAGSTLQSLGATVLVSVVEFNVIP